MGKAVVHRASSDRPRAILVTMSGAANAIHRANWSRAREWTLTALAAAFIVLMVLQYAVDLPRPWERRVHLAQLLIWAAFAIDFFVRLALAPSKAVFLKHDWVAVLALALPAFRVLRIVQVTQGAPSLATSGLIVGGERGGPALRRAFGARPMLYIGVLTLVVTALCSAGMFAIEHDAPDTNINTIGDALWWTTATLTTVGSELYPVTVEGRVLAIFVMVYGLGFAGYLAGTFAAVLLGPRQGDTDQGDVDTAILDELRALHRQLTADTARPPGGDRPMGASESPAEGSQQAAAVPRAADERGTRRV
jgi:voltage-gated potassium channel